MSTIMQDEINTSHTLNLHDLVSLFLRKKMFFLLPFLTVLLLAGTYAVIAQAEYRSSARILIEQQGGVAEDASVANFTEHRIQVISEQIMTRENMREIIRTFSLFPDKTEDKAFDKFKDAVEMHPINTELVDPTSGRVRESTIAFLVAFEYTDPQIAKSVTDNLVSLFLTKNEESRNQRVEQTATFLKEQADRLAEQVAEREAALAAFKERNAGKLPDSQQSNLQLMESTERQMLQVSEQLRSLREQAVFVESELAQTSPTGALVSSTGERILSNEEKLKSLRTELADAKRRYSNDHPDVKRLERQLREVQAGVGGEDASFFSSQPTAPDNPAYIQLQTRLRALQTEIASASRREAALQARLDNFQRAMADSPEIEREYLSLTRDYENVLETFRETKQRMLEAQLSEAAEKGDQSDRFSVLEAPRVAADPVRPNRLAIITIGGLLALISGIIAVFLGDQLDRSVRNARDLEKLIGGPPMGVIGYIEQGHDILRRRVLTALLVLVIAGAAAAGYFSLKGRDDAGAVSSAAAPVNVTERS
ncbi:Wzz/FepE/Etk N-terminal domain-containing protein [Granulosicoccaceae sp. 1_MG-2023]|nr:Wzz/FepE/Etk N-terminal domain-containing protein [Granulosicoccaceae sp. 1_MG-2023]